jgi:hypothetical protein
MLQIADVDGIEQPDGGFLQRRTHTLEPLQTFRVFVRTSLTRLKAATALANVRL